VIYKVIYTESAYRDLDRIFDYIAEVLLEPVIAQNQTDRIMDAAESLDSMPLRYRLYEHEPWRSRGWRIMPVDNYLVFYLPVEAEGIISIMRIMHGSRNIIEHLDDE